MARLSITLVLGVYFLSVGTVAAQGKLRNCRREMASSSCRASAPRAMRRT
jgi:hypothetical protein